jgi:hypothetical protein
MKTFSLDGVEVFHEREQSAVLSGICFQLNQLLGIVIGDW